VLTDYDDCVVVLHERDWNVDRWPGAVNRCTGRVIVVRPVENLAQVSIRYLRHLPRDNLQSFPKHP